VTQSFPRVTCVEVLAHNPYTRADARHEHILKGASVAGLERNVATFVQRPASRPLPVDDQAQGGASSSIRKTGGSAFGATNVA
jgi:hypothetical protein